MAQSLPLNPALAFRAIGVDSAVGSARDCRLGPNGGEGWSDRVGNGVGPGTVGGGTGVAHEAARLSANTIGSLHATCHPVRRTTPLGSSNVLSMSAKAIGG
jgi:hypothetical protein